MVLAIIYFILFCIFVGRLSFFKDDKLTFKLILFFLGIKIIGCIAYYWIYFHYYPGSFKNDSTSTMLDAKVIYDAFLKHPFDYFKMIFGIHSNLESDPLYQTYFVNIEKWGNSDSLPDFFLNDNRTLIRFNAFIMMFSFGNYAVHGFVMLALSFIGQFAFYKTFKSYFPKKEIILASVIFLTPSVLFWTSGVLKEPLALFTVGIFLYSFFQIFIHHSYKTKYIFLLVSSIILFSLIKPYILILLIVPFILFKMVCYFNIKKVFLFYISSLFIVYGFGIVFLKFVLKKDLIQTIVTRQNDFINLSKGGIFFLNETKYIRLDVKDSLSFTKVDLAKKLCKINAHTKLMYWNVNRINNLRDTIFDLDNADTSLYHYQSFSMPAGSGIEMQKLEYNFSSFIKLIPVSFFNVLCKPFFYDSKSITELMASIENLGIFFFFFFCFYYGSFSSTQKNATYCFLFIVILSFLLIGLTTTVMGAIVRYKVPFIYFLLMYPLLFLDINKLKKHTLFKPFFNTN